jgi:hypothetical protein
MWMQPVQRHWLALPLYNPFSAV